MPVNGLQYRALAVATLGAFFAAGDRLELHRRNSRATLASMCKAGREDDLVALARQVRITRSASRLGHVFHVGGLRDRPAPDSTASRPAFVLAQPTR
jgi:hypothetical protein